MKIRLSLLLAAVLVASMSHAADLKPLAPRAVIAAKFASVEASLNLAAEGLKGGCESARTTGDSPFRTLQGMDFRLPAAVYAASQRCPDGMSWKCVPECVQTHPLTGLCTFWIPVCGCM